VGKATPAQKSVRSAILSKPTATGQFTAGKLSGVSSQGTTSSAGTLRNIPYQTIGGKTQTVLPAGTPYLVAPPSSAMAGKLATKSVQEAIKADAYASSNAFIQPNYQQYITQTARAYGTLPAHSQAQAEQYYAETFGIAPVNAPAVIDLQTGQQLAGGGGGAGGIEAGETKPFNWLIVGAIGLIVIGLFGKK